MCPLRAENVTSQVDPSASDDAACNVNALQSANQKNALPFMASTARSPVKPSLRNAQLHLTIEFLRKRSVACIEWHPQQPQD